MRATADPINLRRSSTPTFSVAYPEAESRMCENTNRKRKSCIPIKLYYCEGKFASCNIELRSSQNKKISKNN